VAALWEAMGAEVSLLTVFDLDSRQRFPELVGLAQPPTLAELRKTVEDLRARMARDVKAGDEPVLVIFYSGHGSTPPDRPPALAMLDGGLTRDVLYDEILGRLPARYAHVLVDACHAEAVVRTRDVQAEVVPLDRATLDDYAAHNTLRRFPNAGAFVATSAVSEAHEWDRYQHGVFTFAMLSGLRGGADVNGDGLVEYSELSAFLGSVNAGIGDPRARLAVVARPPAINPHAPLGDLAALRRRAGALTGTGPSVGKFYVEDERGNRLGEMLPEPGFQFQLFLPVDERLYVRTNDSEGSFQLDAGAQRPLASIPMTPRSVRERGAVDSSLRRGLFSVPFGPFYYRGFVDARAELPPVAAITRAQEAAPAAPQPGWLAPAARVTGWALVGLGVGGIVTGIVFEKTLSDKNDDIDHICRSSDPCSSADYARYNTDVTDAGKALHRATAAFWAGGTAMAAGAAVLLSTALLSTEPRRAIVIGASPTGAVVRGVW
jgi:hypothetical protein